MWFFLRFRSQDIDWSIGDSYLRNQSLLLLPYNIRDDVNSKQGHQGHHGGLMVCVFRVERTELRPVRRAEGESETEVSWDVLGTINASSNRFTYYAIANFRLMHFRRAQSSPAGYLYAPCNRSSDPLILWPLHRVFFDEKRQVRLAVSSGCVADFSLLKPSSRYSFERKSSSDSSIIPFSRRMRCNIAWIIFVIWNVHVRADKWLLIYRLFYTSSLKQLCVSPF